MHKASVVDYAHDYDYELILKCDYDFDYDYTKSIINCNQL